MAQVGVPHVLQLDGGILRYFELAAGAPHWHGDCVVFDERGALDPALHAAAPAPAAAPLPAMTLQSRAVKPKPASGWVGVAWWQRLLGLLLMATALAVALFRAPDRPVQTLVARWAPPPSDFVDVKGQIVHLRDQGPRNDPLPIVLIHGTSASLHTWEGWVRALRTQRRVITFDLPGFGLTGPFAGQYHPTTTTATSTPVLCWT
jgi:hypothetical protein